MSISMYFLPSVGQTQIDFPTQIDYTAQLSDVLGRLTTVTSAIQQHDVTNHTDSTNTIAKLNTIFEVAESVRVLAENGNASLSLIKNAIDSVINSTDLVRQSILGFQSQALDELEGIRGLLQTEFDQTQTAIEAINQTAKNISDKLNISEFPLFSRRENVDTSKNSVIATIPSGAAEVVIYPTGSPRSFVINNKNYEAGEQFMSSMLVVGNRLFTHDSIVASIDMGQGTFVIQYKATKNIGEIIISIPVVPPVVPPVNPPVVPPVNPPVNPPVIPTLTSYSFLDGITVNFDANGNDIFTTDTTGQTSLEASTDTGEFYIVGDEVIHELKSNGTYYLSNRLGINLNLAQTTAEIFEANKLVATAKVIPVNSPVVPPVNPPVVPPVNPPVNPPVIPTLTSYSFLDGITINFDANGADIFTTDITGQTSLEASIDAGDFYIVGDEVIHELKSNGTYYLSNRLGINLNLAQTTAEIFEANKLVATAKVIPLITVNPPVVPPVNPPVIPTLTSYSFLDGITVNFDANGNDIFTTDITGQTSLEASTDTGEFYIVGNEVIHELKSNGTYYLSNRLGINLNLAQTTAEIFEANKLVATAKVIPV